MTPKSEVHLIDCMDFLRSVPDKAYSLACVDVPYGIGANKMTLGNGKRKIYRGQNDWDIEPPKTEYFNELKRVSINQIIWGANHFISRMPYDSSCWIFWDKGTGSNDFADGELAWTSFDKTVRKFFKSWVGANAKDGINRIHPTQKPVALYDWIFRNYAKPGDTILDTHMGSQSSRISAYKAGLDYAGCELDPEYFEQGNERFNTFLKKYGTTDPDKAIPGQQINIF